MKRLLRPLVRPLLDENPITVQVLGICSALAVTKTLATALVMSAALTAVLVVATVTISLIRSVVPHSTRLIVQITIIASLVIAADLLIAAYAPDMSRQLSIFVGLIITNCIVLGRAESFAMHNPPGPTFLDALGNALGYTFILTMVGFVRELLGSGTLLGHTVLPRVEDGGWFQPIGLLLLAPSAFFLIGLFIWALRALRPVDAEGIG
jgi:Na+-transporting NADH:ubiquinone oxidoreductase subunit D